ncbi:DUF6080 domain-containing protein [Falsiporphyromonas endometrii]|uniref:DUF6080 domain-containing protein n=1 Tax=Falsiporphyromonas endometrii TaxID=1387297 RepID=A0ABV9K6D3_9PORP
MKFIQKVWQILLNYSKCINRFEVSSFHKKYNEEIVFFCILFVLYLALSTFAFHQLKHELLSITTDSPINGSMLGWDSYKFFRRAGGSFDIAHPIVAPIHILLYPILFVIGMPYGYYFQIVLMTTLVTLSCTAIFSFARRLRNLSRTSSALLSLLTGSSFTALSLTFNPEYYPFSLLVLTLSLCFLYRDQLKYDRYRIRTSLFFGFCSGALTLTNVAKPTLALLFNKPFKKYFGYAAKFAVAFTLLIAVIATMYSIKSRIMTGNYIDFAYEIEDYSTWIKNTHINPFDAYFSQAIIAPKLKLQEIYNEVVYRPTPYSGALRLISVGCIAAIIGLSMIGIYRNINNRFVYLIFGYLCVDIFVNIICKYGLNEAIIFGAHWISVPSFLIALAYPESTNDQNKRLQTYLIDTILFILIAILLYANLYQLFTTVLK